MGLEGSTITVRFFSNYLALQRLEKVSKPKRERHRLALLNRVLEHAYKHVPMYQELYSAQGESSFQKLNHIDELSKLPGLRKNHIQTAFPDRSTSATANHSHLYQIATSGTSDRIMLFHDEDKRNWDRAADLLLKRRTEGFGKVLTIPPDDCYERCGLEDSEPAPLYSTLLDAMTQRGQARVEAKQKILSRLASKLLWRDFAMKAPGVDGTSVSQDIIDHYFDTIDKLSPDTVKAFPYYFWMLAQRGHHRTFREVKFLRPSGGKATPMMIRGIEKNLGARFRENYGTAELGTIAMDTQNSRAQNLIESLFIVEFIRNGKPAKVGELAELVITDLHNLASPLIRYHVGDVGRILKNDQDSTLTFEVNGRFDETIVTPLGKILSSDETIDFFLQHDLPFCKLLQHDDQNYTLESVTTPYDETALARHFCELLEHPVQLSIRRVRRIAPEASGKFKLVTSTSYERLAAD